jgi:DNA-binding transcriptional LysR family regulator
VGLFESGSHDELDLQVERGSLDLAFTNPPLPQDTPLEYTELLTDPYVLVVARDHPLARRRVLPSLGILADIDLVGYRVCRANASIERFLRSRGVEPLVVVRAEDNHLLQGLAAAGVGAAIMPILAVDRSRDDTVILDASRLIPNRRIGIVRHRDRYRSPAALAFVELARDTVRSIEVPRP